MLKRCDLVGEVFTGNYGNFLVWKIFSKKAIVIFDNGYTKETYISQIKKGTVKNPYFPCVQGVGFIGEGTYSPYPNGAKSGCSKEYKCWSSMLERCYSKAFKKRNGAYEGCTVCEEWHNFQNFAKWCNEQSDFHVVGSQLDKDLKVIGNRTYSPETCLFVSGEVNNFLVGLTKISTLPLGVYLYKKTSLTKRYRAEMSCKDLDVWSMHETQEGAHRAWQVFKADRARSLADKQNSLDVKTALLRFSDRLEHDALLGIESKFVI